MMSILEEIISVLSISRTVARLPVFLGACSAIGIPSRTGTSRALLKDK